MKNNKEWKCNACNMPCILILNVLDDDPGACPFDDTRFITWTCGKPEPLPPTHEEIMTLWWKTNQGAWIKPMGYWAGNYMLVNTTFNRPVITQDRSYFTNRESKVIPPEAI